MNSTTHKVFHYADGNIVTVGDLVNTGNTPKGVVLSIIQAGSDKAEAYGCPEGGVLIEENWNGTPSLLLMEPPDGDQWEDLVLISRAPRKE